MEYVEKKQLRLRPDKYFEDHIHCFESSFTCELLDERYKGTFKEALRIQEVKINFAMTKKLDEQTHGELKKAWSKHHPDEKSLSDDELGALVDRYILCYVVVKISDMLDQLNGQTIAYEEINIHFEGDKTDVERFVKHERLFVPMPQKGEWSELIVWVANPKEKSRIA